jgi:hypothetical protein
MKRDSSKFLVYNPNTKNMKIFRIINNDKKIILKKDFLFKLKNWEKLFKLSTFILDFLDFNNFISELKYLSFTDDIKNLKWS